MKNIILIGAQGSGKGTQAEKLKCALGLRHVSSGDLFRKAFDEKTSLGLKARGYVDRGELVPDAITVAMVLEQVEQLGRVEGILLDGFPRTIAQAQALDQGLLRGRRYIENAVYLEVPREELRTRLSGRYICRANQHVYNLSSQPPKIDGLCDLDGSELYQRTDDKGEAVNKRLNTFFSETIRLLDYYEKQKKLIRVNGNQDIERVYRDVMSALHEEVSQKEAVSILPWQLPARPSTTLPRF